jgi:hypothetical protein
VINRKDLATGLHAISAAVMDEPSEVMVALTMVCDGGGV